MSKFSGKAVSLFISQNFLTKSATIHRLLQLTDITAADTVLEIGAGKGHITKALAARAAQVLTYELDVQLAQRLRPALPQNVRLYQQDFLRSPLPTAPYKVFANIPFSRTTEIVRKLTQGTSAPESAWLLMEKGAALRFCGLPRENTMSLSIKPLYDVRIAYRLHREDFHPAPRVDVVMLEFRRKPQPDLPRQAIPAFQQFFAQAHRRSLTSLLTKKQIATALHLENLPPIAESAEMKYVQWLCLFRCWEKFGKR